MPCYIHELNPYYICFFSEQKINASVVFTWIWKDGKFAFICKDFIDKRWRLMDYAYCIQVKTS